LEAVPLKSMDTAACVHALIYTWISRFGVPSVITSDRGSQFTSAVWSGLCKLLGVEHITTTAYHPQSNGMVERAHRQVKDALRARAAGVNWLEHLPWVLLGLRAAPKEDSGISSAELVFGAPVTLPGQFLAAGEPPAQSFLDQLRDLPALATRARSYAQVAAAPPAALQAATHVYIKRGGAVPPLADQYSGPYIVKKHCEKFALVEVGGRVEAVSVDRLKPHRGEGAVSPAVPPPRGRPPSSVQPPLRE
jgi:hypothetical protein